MYSAHQIIILLKSKAALIQADFGLQSLTLIGSYAEGNQNSHSDIDLIYEMQQGQKMTLARLTRLEVLIKQLSDVERTELINKKYINPLVYENSRANAIPHLLMSNF